MSAFAKTDRKKNKCRSKEKECLARLSDRDTKSRSIDAHIDMKTIVWAKKKPSLFSSFIYLIFVFSVSSLEFWPLLTCVIDGRNSKITHKTDVKTRWKR